MTQRNRDARRCFGHFCVGGMARLVAIGAVLLLGGCYTASSRGDISWLKYSPPPALQAETPRPQRNLSVLDWVWTTINTYYYESDFHGIDWAAARERHRAAAEAAADDDELYRVINAMLGELKDGHTFARSPRAVAERRDRRWVWIGLEYATLAGSRDKVVVTYLWPGGPAMQAGVRRGWILESCDGQGARTFLKDRRLEDGQRVACAFRDENNQSRQVELVAHPVSHPPVREARVLTGGCVYLRFDEFKDPDTKWLYEQLQTHRNAPAVILDQRYNAGGDLVSLGYIAGLFLPRGQELGAFVKHDRNPETMNSRRPLFRSRYAGPLAIIVSPSSASAAEIFANAMQRYRHGVVVGQVTAGSVLNAYQGALPDGGELSFSVRDFRTPEGRRLEGNGVEPDAVVEYHLDNLRAGNDPGIEEALNALRSPAVEISR